MIKKFDSNKARLKRHARVRRKISGTPEVPRLNVFRSDKHIYAQIIDDVNGVTLAAANSLSKGFDGNGGNIEGAKKGGEMIAMSYSTEAAICITEECRLSLRLPVRTV